MEHNKCKNNFTFIFKLSQSSYKTDPFAIAWSRWCGCRIDTIREKRKNTRMRERKSYIRFIKVPTNLFSLDWLEWTDFIWWFGPLNPCLTPAGPNRLWRSTYKNKKRNEKKMSQKKEQSIHVWARMGRIRPLVIISMDYIPIYHIIKHGVWRTMATKHPYSLCTCTLAHKIYSRMGR